MRTLAALALAVTSVPALSTTYSASPVASPQDAKIIARDVMWRCEGAECRAVDSASRPGTVCSGFVKKAGRVTRFVAGSVAFEPSALEKCNASAR